MWQEFDGIRVLGADCGEVAVVERCELALVQSLHDCNNCGIDKSELQVGVAGKQLAYTHVVSPDQVHDRYIVSLDIGEERREWLQPGSAARKPLPLDYDRSWNK